MNKAEAAANYVRHFFTDGHHGAFEQGDHVIVYGLDHYDTNEQARRTVEMMKRAMAECEIADCTFGVSDDGIAWALVVTTDANHIVDPDGLHEAVWSCWFASCGEQPNR